MLQACTTASFVSPTCDPRALEAGEVRARQVLCTDELIPDGDGHVGDWLIENSLARFVLRGTYSSLYTLDEPGGTLIDAVAVNPDGTTTPDVLGELRVAGERSSVEVVNPTEGEPAIASLVLPGMTWSLSADEAVLRLTSAGAAVVAPLPGAERTGTTWTLGAGFLGVDGTATAGELPTTALTPTFVAPERQAWTSAAYGSAAEVAAAVDADTVRVEVGGEAVTRLPVVDGEAEGWAPGGAVLQGERAGCTYDGLVLLACGSMNLRVRDGAGDDLASTYTVGGVSWVLPPGGGVVPAGADALLGVLTAGPAYPAVTVPYVPDARPGAAVSETLAQEMDVDGAVWADLSRVVAPDPDAAWASPEATHDATGEGIGYVVVIADDEVPTAATDPLDALGAMDTGEGPRLVATAGVRSHSFEGGTVVSWPWSGNSKKPAHGVPPGGLDALDLLSVARDNSSDRRTIVDRAWVDAALADAPTYAWPDAPTAVWLGSLADLDVYLTLLEGYVPVAPVGPRTWIELPTGDHNAPGVEAGIFSGETTAGNGPRIEVLGGLHVGENRVWDVVVHAARWMDVREVTLHTPEGSVALDLDPFEEPSGGGTVRVRVPATEPWVVATVQGASGIWAVRGF